ncbi:MAG: CoA transferase subunit A [Oscillospiraceae bacterium]|nr:CoA transferase subunit A [Oscillospiraceae bacterium]
MISKRFSREEIIAQFHDGQTIMTGGFSFHGCPELLFDALVESGARHLTNIALDASAARLMHLGIFDRVIIAHAGSVPENLALMASGKIEVEFCPMGTLAERIRAGGVGLGGVLVKTGLGTVAEKGKERITFQGEEYILESALRADISLVRAATADHYGNLTYAGTARNANPVIAMAGDLTIVQADRFVPLDEIPPEHIVTPGVFVDMILDHETGGGC